MLNAKKKGRCGRKFKEPDLEKMKEIPQKQRTTIRKFATAFGVSPSTIYRWIKRGIIKPHSNSMKPRLTNAQKITRLHWVMSLSVPKTLTKKLRFQNLCNLVHIDEKWFYMSQVTQKYYLLDGEEDPYRCIQSKNHIPKMMFIGGIARPVLGGQGEILWDGKLGIFPFVEKRAAIRSSINREKGTIETKAIQKITRPVIREMLLTQMIPRIKAKWPSFLSKTIWIQQDNARPHVLVDDVQFLEVAQQDGFDIHLICQPAQSPDLNILDLGFFRAIQSIQYKAFPKNEDELIKSV